MIGKFSIRETLEAFLEAGRWSSFPGSSRAMREESHVCTIIVLIIFGLSAHTHTHTHTHTNKQTSIMKFLPTYIYINTYMRQGLGLGKAYHCPLPSVLQFTLIMKINPTMNSNICHIHFIYTIKSTC